MQLDILGTNNYSSFNIKLAELIGLHEAIYLNQLININHKAIEKKKIDNDFFTVDRKYIRQRTTIDRNEQLRLDKALSDLGILSIDEQNNCKLKINLSVILSILDADQNSGTVLALQDIKLSKPKKETKEQQACNAMKALIETTNTELYEAYCDWIDAVYAKLHWMSKKAVIFGQQLVDETSHKDLDVALKILELATVNGYKDMTWAVKLYKEQYARSFQVVNFSNPCYNNVEKKKVEVSGEVF